MLWICKASNSQKYTFLAQGIERFIWEDNFMICCQDLEIYNEWVHDLVEVVKLNNRKLPRKKFIDEFNALKGEGNVQPMQEKEMLLTPSEIDEFKINLKNSVLLSYGQAIKPSRPKQVSKIQSVMFSSQSKYVRNTNFPASGTKSERKRSDLYLGESKRQSILKQRQRALRQSFSKTGFRQSLMSFIDDTMSSIFRGQQKQISKQSAQALSVFMKFSLILQKHLNDPSHIINKIIESFQNFIYKKYTIFNSSNSEQKKQVVKQFQNSQRQKQFLQLEEIEQKWKNNVKKQRFKQLQNRKNLTLEEIEELTTDIKIFLSLLSSIVIDYYKTSQFVYNNIHSQSLNDESWGDYTSYTANTNFLIVNQDNILTLVTAILFKNEKFYNHIFCIFKKFNEEREQNFKKILINLEGQPPQYFQIKRQYCLNQYTLEELPNENYQKNQAIGDHNTTNDCSNEKQSDNEKDGQRQQTQAKSITNKSLTQPKSYIKCVQSLLKLSKSKTPTSKLKIIMQCSQKITQSLSEFYHAHSIELKNEILDADQILSIFCYILSINLLQNLHSHLFMIKSFATQNQMISRTGYYYSALTCALEQLQNMYSSTLAGGTVTKNQNINQNLNNETAKKPSKTQNISSINPNKDIMKRSFRNN